MTNEQEFVRLVMQNERIFYKVASFYAKTNESRKDLYQEIVLQLWKAYPSFRNDAKISTWIYRIALNTAVTLIRKEKRAVSLASMDIYKVQLPDNIDSELDDRIQQLYKQIEHLNQLEKALVLLYLEEKSYAEISEITGISESNVGTRLSRIKQKLREQMFNQ